MRWSLARAAPAGWWRGGGSFFRVTRTILPVEDERHRDGERFGDGTCLAPGRFDMHVAGVTQRSVKTAATGGDVDPLALLFGAETATATAAFPLTLQAALAAGSAATVPDGVDVGTALAVDAEEASTDAGDATAEVGAAAALAAAALALGADGTAFPSVPVASGDPSASGAIPSASGAIPSANGSGEAATTIAVATTASTPSGAAAMALVETDAGALDLTATGAGTDEKVSTDEVAAPVAIVTKPAASAAPAIVLPATPDDAAPSAATRPAPTGGLATPEDDSGAARVSGAGVAAAPPAAPNVETPPTGARAHGAHGLSAGTAIAASGAGDDADHPALDLGTSERESQAVGVPHRDPRATGTFVGPAVPETVATTTVPPTSSEIRQGTMAVPTSVTTTNHQDAGAAQSGSHAGLHPSGIEARWGERVVDALRLSSLRGGAEIRLQLEPEGLGHIDVRLHLHSDGVRAVIVTEHESTRALLNGQQQVLQDAFARSDLKLSGFSVDVGSDGGAASFMRREPGDDNGQGDPAAPLLASVTGGVGDRREVSVERAGGGQLSVRV